MTIAACHLSPEGVVLGADSATTFSGGPDGVCHLDYAQKVFEVGPVGSSVGLVTWGLGQIGSESHRTIAARLGFQHAATNFPNLGEMAIALATNLEEIFTKAYGAEVEKCQSLLVKSEKSGELPKDEQTLLRVLINTLSGGYCLAGRAGSHGYCEAMEILWGPTTPKPAVRALNPEQPVFWGVPQIMERLIYGIDSPIIFDILESGKWTGTQNELIELVSQNQMISPRLLPIREAIDWVHTVIHTTIRGTKFAKLPHWCGGPVEIAVITTDRPFRWVRHKSLDAAIITAEESRL